MKTAISAVALLTSLVTMTASATFAATPCDDLLDNNVYRCHIKADFLPDPFDDCFRFTSPGVQSEDFDLFVDGLGIVQGCDCSATGSFSKPKFGAAKEFHCVATATGGYGIAFRGTASGTKIKDGRIIDEFGASYVYECERDPECLRPAAASVRGAQYGQ